MAQKIWYIVLCVGMSTACIFAEKTTYPLGNDKQAYDYCISHQKSFIAIVWPIAEGHDDTIQYLFEKYGTIKYRKNFYFTYEQALQILRQAHPHIVAMHEHVLWYFPPWAYEKAARIFVIKFETADDAVTCKHAIRRLFTLQYRSVHINDTYDETMYLAEFFFGKR